MWCHFLNLKLVQVASILFQRIFISICTDRLLPCHLRNRNPPDFISRDQHKVEVPEILLGVKTRRGLGQPLDQLLVVVKCPRFDLNRVDRPAPFCDQIEYGCIGVSAAIQPLVFKVSRNFRQQLIGLHLSSATIVFAYEISHNFNPERHLRHCPDCFIVFFARIKSPA